MTPEAQLRADLLAALAGLTEEEEAQAEVLVKALCEQFNKDD